VNQMINNNTMIAYSITTSDYEATFCLLQKRYLVW